MSENGQTGETVGEFLARSRPLDPSKLPSRRRRPAPQLPMTADLTPAQAARLEAIEAAPWAEEAAVERVARAMADGGMHVYAERGWDDLQDDERDVFRLYAVAAIDVMRGATDDGAVGLQTDRERLGVTCDCLGPPYYVCPHWPARAAAVGTPATAGGGDRG